MKTDLVTAIIAAIIGVVVAFVIWNIALPGMDDVSFKVLNSGASYELAEPNEDVFNYRAVNPTVEVYVGTEGSAAR